MHKFNLLTGVFALSMFSYAQYSGWNMFDNTVSQGGPGSSSGGRSSAIYHK